MPVTRPWVQPQEVKDYSDHKEIQERADEKLKTDIFRAEQKVIAKTHNKFDAEDLEAIPECVKVAVILIAEAIGKNNIESTKKQVRSETFDDYSYTVESSTVDIDALDLDDLLKDYIIDGGRGNVTMKLRSL